MKEALTAKNAKLKKMKIMNTKTEFKDIITNYEKEIELDQKKNIRFFFYMLISWSILIYLLL